MTLLFTEQFDALIWKIIEVNGEPSLGIELRSEEDLQVQYRVVDLQSFDQVIYENEALDWWTSLQGVDGVKVWVKKFEEENDPSAFVWWSVDRVSGELFEEPLPDHLNGESTVAILPVVYQQGTEAFEKVRRFLELKGIAAVEALEYLEIESNILIAYYIRKNKQLSRHVYVMNKEGDLLMDRRIDENMDGVVFQSFLTYQNLLIFAENRNELHVYEL